MLALTFGFVALGVCAVLKLLSLPGGAAARYETWLWVVVPATGVLGAAVGRNYAVFLNESLRTRQARRLARPE